MHRGRHVAGLSKLRIVHVTLTAQWVGGFPLALFTTVSVEPAPVMQRIAACLPSRAVTGLVSQTDIATAS